MKNNDTSYTGNIASVRNLEDCIRATKKYSEGVHIMATKHPIQGEEFPSKKFCKYYEFYPDMEISWDMPVGRAVEWLFGNPRVINITFIYDYRMNKAEVQIDGGKDLTELQHVIPGFGNAVMDVIASRGVPQVTHGGKI